MIVSTCGTVKNNGDPFVTVLSSNSPTGGAFTCHGWAPVRLFRPAEAVHVAAELCAAGRL